MTSPANPLISQKWVESRINKGMVTVLEPANLPTGAFQLVQNANVRYDQTLRRAGSSFLIPTRPDTNPVLRIVAFKKEDGTSYTLRVTPLTVNRLGLGLWNALVIGAGLHGSATDYISTADILNTLIMANNGADPIQVIDPAGLTVGPLGDAPAYRYITGFFNRGVGAARAGVNEVEVGWSGDGNITEWNPAVDDTAGSTPLIDSPSDLSDFITGIYGLTNVMLVMREKSIWLANKQPIPTNPFYFYSAIPGIGSDCPYSQQITTEGIAFLDTHSGSVWHYTPGMPRPERIGEAIEKTIISSINDPKTVFSSYLSRFDEYTIFIPSPGSNVVQGWTFNRRTQAWTYNEFFEITCSDDAGFATVGLPIKNLIGKIKDLKGKIKDLKATNSSPTVLSYGRSDGEIVIDDPLADSDAGQAPFETILTSKVFRLPAFDEYIAKIVIEYICTRVGTLILEYSKSGGDLSDWITAKTITANALGKPTNLILRRVIKTRRLAWRLRLSAGAFDLLSYEIHVYPSGEARG